VEKRNWGILQKFARTEQAGMSYFQPASSPDNQSTGDVKCEGKGEMPTRKDGNGLTLLQRFVGDGFSHAATSFVESLKINSISERQHHNRRLVVKRRNPYGGRAADLINFYFRLADIPIRFLSDVRKWRRWEVHCFQMLNGDRFHAAVTDTRTVSLDKLPGKSLWDHMKRGTLDTRMLAAAGREFRRAHEYSPNKFGAPWSHADASMTNVIYNQRTSRARLIDFEIVHEKSFPAVARHADDLRVFLLDMVEMIPARQWLPFATCFLKAYGNREVMAELRRQLVIPTGLALIWWNVRTNFANRAQAKARLQELRGAITSLGDLSARSRRTRAPKPAAFDNLPRQQRRNANR
jgi:hypothetical protein